MKKRLKASLDSLGMVNKRAWLNAGLNYSEGLLRKPEPISYPMALDIVLTKACNLRCTICIAYGSLRGERWMPFERYRLIARELFPRARGIYICSGGEPFLYPRILDALALACQYRTLTCVTSNGMLVDQEIARALVAEQTLHELFVSFDGSKKATLERIRRGADYDKILANIEYLTRLKKDSGLPYPRVALRYVITLSNIEEMPEIFEICARLGIYKVEVVYLNVPNESDFEESLFNHQDLAAKVFPQARRQAWRFGIRLSLPPLPNDHDRGSKCMYPWRFCQIDTDGSIRFCYHSWRQRLGFIEDGFESIWRGEHYRKIRLTVDSEQPYYPHCRVCSVRRGFGLESSHRKDFESDSYVIAGLEKLQVPFTERAEENLSSFREIKAKRASFEQQGREAADFPRE